MQMSGISPHSKRIHGWACSCEQFTAADDDESTLKQDTFTVGLSYFPCIDRWLFGRLWTSFPGNLCLIHEREYNFHRLKNRTGQFPSRFAVRSSRSLFRHWQFPGELL